MALLGRNGVGRSTTCKAIMGLVPAGGRIAFKGRPIAGLRPDQIAHLGLGYVPEDRQIFPTLTVHAEPGAWPEARRPPGRWTFDDMFGLFPNLGERRHNQAGVLSGGEQQMLTVCRTLMGDPDLVIIDEPTEGLAPKLVDQVATLLGEIARRGVSILLVEQKLTIALKIARRVTSWAMAASYSRARRPRSSRARASAGSTSRSYGAASHRARRRRARGSGVGYRLGIDVGGTFTDLVLYGEESGAFTVEKVPSVPADPAGGIVEGIVRLLRASGVAPGAVGHVAHGTTVATNALLERTGARTALIATRGFRDLLEIARQKRPALYDLLAGKPAPLVPRHRRFEVAERVMGDGRVRIPLEPAEVERVLDRLAAEAAAEPVEALAICLLYAFVAPEHERALLERARARWPALAAVASHGGRRDRA